jgi:hypothetical protein
MGASVIVRGASFEIDNVCRCSRNLDFAYSFLLVTEWFASLGVALDTERQ